MDGNDLKTLITQGESAQLEFKTSFQKQVIETLVAFAVDGPDIATVKQCIIMLKEMIDQSVSPFAVDLVNLPLASTTFLQEI